MTRILADLSDDDIAWLDARASQERKSRASVLREAVQAYRAGAPSNWLETGFGAWKDRTDIGDAVDWQRRERASWTRPWDPDYEEVRTEFPDLFDEEDDREHELHRAWLAGEGRSLRDGLGRPARSSQVQTPTGSKKSADRNERSSRVKRPKK